MSKGGKIIPALVGAAIVLFGAEQLHPGSSAETTNAGRQTAGNVIQNVEAVVGDAARGAGPMIADIKGAVAQSGIGDAISGATGAAPAQPGAVPPAQQAPLGGTDGR